MGRSHGSPQRGHSAPSFTPGSVTALRLTAPPKPGDEEPVCAVAVWEQLEVTRAVPRVRPLGVLAHQVIGLELAVLTEEASDQDLGFRG